LLSKADICLKLNLTVDKYTLEDMSKKVEDFDMIAHLVEPVGFLPRERALRLLHDSRALIFPSLVESFGLPLIEAGVLNVPIIASEKDFVRDVCVPSQTFDPSSPRSISQAVIRFLGGKNNLSLQISEQDVWMKLLGEKSNKKNG